MKSKVVLNQGFYIARYEASNNSGIAESKALKMPWNNIAWSGKSEMNAEPSIGTASYEGRHASEKLGYTSVQSTLIYGVQWDNAFKFIENTGTDVRNATSWGNYRDAAFSYTTESNQTATKENGKSILIPTGATARHMKQNINDIAGNVNEWTMEAANSGSFRINRGSVYFFDGFTSAVRDDNEPWLATAGLGFRVALYIK